MTQDSHSWMTIYPKEVHAVSPGHSTDMFAGVQQESGWTSHTPINRRDRDGSTDPESTS